MQDGDATGGDLVENAGAVYIFERDDTGNWNQIQKIVASDRSVNNDFGISVSICDNYLVVGAPANEEDAFGNDPMFWAGAAYVFVRDGADNWSQQAKLLAADGETGDFFGWGISLSGDTIVAFECFF